MSESDSRLMAGEEIIFKTSKHWLAPIADSWKAILLIIASLVLAWLQTDQIDGLIGFGNRVLGLLETVLMLAGIALIIYNVIAWRSAKYMVTNQRVLGQDGLAHKRETDSLLTSISDVRSKSSFVGRIFGYGSVMILSASGEAGADSFTTVRKADEFKRRILEQKIASSLPMRPELAQSWRQPRQPLTRRESWTATACRTRRRVLTTLAVLASLRDAETISPAEYEAKKTELLARI